MATNQPPQRVTSAEGGSSFREILGHIGVAVFVYDDERVLWVNHAAEELLGRSREEMLNDTLSHLLLREVTNGPALEKGQSGLYLATEQPIETRIRRPDGSECYAAVTFTSMPFEGDTTGCATVVDITGHRTLADRLTENIDRLRLALKAGNAVTWTWELTTDKMEFSTESWRRLGWPKDLIPTSGDELLEHIPQEDREAISARFRRVFSEGVPYVLEHRLVFPDESERWAAVQGYPQRDASGRVVRIVGVSVDITPRKQAEGELRREKERAQVTLASISDGVIRTDAAGDIDYLNPAAERLVAVSIEAAASRPIETVYRVVAEDDGTSVTNPVRLCLDLARPVQPLTPSNLVAADGKEIAVGHSAAPIIDADGGVVGAVLVFTDVTDLRILEKKMAHLASHDPLTGLINRREFEQRLRAAIAAAVTTGGFYALGYLDLDDFKIVNDTCGHSAGDELLRQLASVLEATITTGDTLARLGGDEFGLILSVESTAQAVERCNAILDAIRSFRFLWHEQLFDIRASIGLVPVAESGGSVAQLLSAADAACFVAKDRGRNRIHISEPEDAEVAARQSEMLWVQRIRNALDEDRLLLFAQEIHRLDSGAGPRLIEILVRLVNSDGRNVKPEQFLPAAERYNLMPRLDRWIIRQSIEVIARMDVGADTARFTINLSGQSLGDPRIRSYILSQVERYLVHPEQILFEITETTAVSNLKTAQTIIGDLKDHGFRFILDDFGSGLSSFRYLKNLDVSFLKIDGNLVAEVADDPIQREMVSAIHRVGESMGLLTIGEWVETPETAAVLDQIGINYAQGYWFHRPEPLEDLIRRLSAGK